MIRSRERAKYSTLERNSGGRSKKRKGGFDPPSSAVWDIAESVWLVSGGNA